MTTYECLGCIQTHMNLVRLKIKIHSVYYEKRMHTCFIYVKNVLHKIPSWNISLQLVEIRNETRNCQIKTNYSRSKLINHR